MTDHDRQADHDSQAEPEAVEPLPDLVPPPVPVVNIPNILTVLRILLVPVFVVLFFTAGAEEPMWRWAAFGAFAIAMCTDYVDGWWARRKNLVTDFGKLADPIADKALVAAALISLSIAGELYWWITVVILVRELGITLWRFVGVDYVVPAGRGGKAKTMAQSIGLGLLIAPLPHWVWPLEWAIMGLAVVLTVWTGIDYVVKARKIAKAEEAEASAASGAAPGAADSAPTSRTRR